MKISDLEIHAQKCLQNNLPLKILVTMPNFESPELIINPPENISKKMDYYKATYDENCNHKHAEGIAIVEVVHDDVLSEELHVGQALLPYNSSMLENHIRIEDSYTVGDRSKSRTFEGQVGDVLKALEFFKGDSTND